MEAWERLLFLANIHKPIYKPLPDSMFSSSSNHEKDHKVRKVRIAKETESKDGNVLAQAFMATSQYTAKPPYTSLPHKQAPPYKAPSSLSLVPWWIGIPPNESPPYLDERLIPDGHRFAPHQHIYNKGDTGGTLYTIRQTNCVIMHGQGSTGGSFPGKSPPEKAAPPGNPPPPAKAKPAA